MMSKDEKQRDKAYEIAIRQLSTLLQYSHHKPQPWVIAYREGVSACIEELRTIRKLLATLPSLNKEEANV